MTELYRAWTKGTGEDLPEGMILWVPLRAERIRVAPYSVLVKGIENIHPTALSAVKGYIDEFFTVDELYKLKDCIEGSSDLHLTFSEYKAPLNCTDDNGEPLIPYRCRGLENIAERKGFIARLVSYLPFDVAGYLVSCREKEQNCLR
jgi:hypothetical protein